MTQPQHLSDNLSLHHSAYRAELAVDRFGLQLASRLSEGTNQLGHDVSERLRVARQQALALRKQPALSRVRVRAHVGAGAVVNNGNSATLGTGGDEPGLWGRLASFLPLIVLVVGLVGINVVQNDRRAKEVAEVDAALLTDDLPPHAYTDPGFAQFLKVQRGQENGQAGSSGK